MKLKDANYKSYWNILVFCDQWKMMSVLNMSHEKMSDFVSFPLFEFTLVTKLKNFNIEGHWKTSMFLINRNMTSDLNMSNGKMSDFV